MEFIWLDYNAQFAREINDWLIHEETNKFLDIDDWHSAYLNIINGIEFYYLNDTDREKSYYKLNDDYYCKLVFEKDKLVAIMSIYLNPIDKTIHINPIIVSPNLQGKGYGTAVIKDFIFNVYNILGENYCSKINITIEKGNQASKACFGKCGFLYLKDNDDDSDYEIYEYQIN
ncbi:hypothetical protein DNH61_03615 [Paenibacillus sambharensis]|uniref:N-acetyltransferase domain-containing protein n=1 Tax=Paenibacillus sambharensis TaxID=1803190 RepID=A0A2W1LDS7_9BACL|nr:GNAT family N-acetyltransferase [Paenibacillus sambharensis]PZD97236.1 hypothetical protein DNH61_03615 [Paenibacillus sambharensis]